MAGGGTTSEEDEAEAVLAEAAVQMVEDMKAEDMAVAVAVAVVLVLIADGTVI